MGYRIYRKPLDIVLETFLGGVRHDTFWALRDIDLKVREGDRLGIVGPNGAGKSTLLKIICGNLSQTSGRVDVNGRISSLLSMTPAWNEEETGIENIKNNLLLQGVVRRQIPNLIEEIVDFTELGAFIYQPVKTYSTGMGARLSFAIATATNPDILIIDEVLGTGDGYFAAKASERMKTFCRRGRAIVFVSHSVAAVQQLCDRVLWMQNGSVRMVGSADKVLAQYELDYRRSEDEATRVGNAALLSHAAPSPDPCEVSETRIYFRIVPQDGSHLKRTHYINSIILIEADSARTTQIPLEFAGYNCAKSEAYLDVASSEWGRIYEKHGIICRALQRITGRNVGGQFSVAGEHFGIEKNGAARISLTFTSFCDFEDEKLEVQILDWNLAEWRRLGELTAQPSDQKGWVENTVTGSFLLPESSVLKRLTAELIAQQRQSVVITKVSLLVSNTEVAVLTEGTPFSVGVEVSFNSQIKNADVGIKITRNDGTYVFWQSSGMTSEGNLSNVEGLKTIAFVFEENLLGCGEYYVNAYVANGWNFPNNYPYSQVYDRKVNALIFRVKPLHEGLDFGIIAKVVPVQVS
jgi:lipopolysaccharide transport system ATP-binding protein